MFRIIFHPALVVFAGLSLAYAGCGGGSSGTGTGPELGRSSRFSGVIVSQSGTGIPSAQVTVLNSDVSAETDEAGAFELTTEFEGGNAELQVEVPDHAAALLTITDLPSNPEEVQVSILFDTTTDSVSLLSVTLRARIVRSCAPMFFNAQTMQQTGPIPVNFACTVEATIKSDGLPVNDLRLVLETRGCASESPWTKLGDAMTGSSGPGTAEMTFAFRSDDERCVYRVRGPLDVDGVVPLVAHIHTLRKQAFDRGQD